MVTPTGPSQTVIELRATRVITILLIVLISAEVFFVLADHFINVERLTDKGPIRRFFNITREDGIASWFAVIQTWMIGLTAGLVYAAVKSQGGAGWRRTGWLILTIFFLYLAMDDGAEFHERIGSSVKAIILGDQPKGASRAIGIFPSYTWQLVFLPIFGAIGLYILWFLNRELDRGRDKLLVVAAIGLLVLAVVADFFEGLDNDQHPLNLYAWLKSSQGWSSGAILHYSKSAEEFMEMLSMTTFWFLFLRHLMRVAPRLEIRFG
ncbi:MAG: hypothetical protein KJO82_04715 [Gammaproteobacteria bacterium]|nr:hypothetical protein [Gammaproteobacteria bacterium]